MTAPNLQIINLQSIESMVLTPHPSVCLLVIDAISPAMDFKGLVRTFMPAGCQYFMILGDAAEDVHDALDYAIDDCNLGYLGTPTAVHNDDSAEDVASFLVNAAIPDEANVRCVVGYDKEDDAVRDILEKLRLKSPEMSEHSIPNHQMV
ncbi:hypothetical protein ACQYWY_04710 [Comamonas sediminis]|uniref:hypothetical protein n=1 Tax=Comamonas sediminis TaxID=1783360 RepID=UPI003D2B4789